MTVVEIFSSTSEVQDRHVGRLLVIIAIDLGTTFSVVGVAGRAKLRHGYPTALYLDGFDVSIIPDPFGNYTIPSAVWEDPDQPGELVVGLQAKQAVGEGQDPIQFSKRNIGTNITHQLGGREYSARQVARILLEYLKGIAEDALDERVDRAVITHPAYFDPAMMEETGLAAQDAGFDFDREKHLLMEPIAAALAYTRNDPRDPLRVLTYDLGGGTFDVTVMERRKGVVNIRAFGGNRLLGGFNFDRELATWMYERLRERGVQLILREDEPSDRAKWVRLLQLAEDTKLKLAKARTDRVPVLIREQAIFADDRGMDINLIDQITREEFVDLIRELLEETITGPGGDSATKGCNITLAETGVTIEQVDEILLVGGSSGGPWVQQTIQRMWGREPLVFEPDLCVAAGAVIHARSLPEVVPGEMCRVEVNVPRQSPLDSINVAGRVSWVAGKTQPPGLMVVLTSALGNRRQVNLADEGTFFFVDVELAPESTTNFSLTIADGERRKIVTHEFEVTHSLERTTEATGVLTVLPKPLYIETVSGMKPLAEEGVALPAHCEVDLARANDDDNIEIRLFQETEPIGSTLIRDVPKKASVGASVKLVVDISRNNRITGRAVVYTRKNAVAIEALVDVRIPPLQVPDIGFLRTEFAELQEELQERLELERSAETRLVLQARGDKICQRLERDFGGPSPDRQEVWLALRELRRLIRPARDEMEPPLDYFERLVLHVRDILAASSADPQIQAHTRICERLENEGRVAYGRKDRRSWTQVCSRLDDVRRRLEPKVRSDPGEVPPTFLQKHFEQMLLDQTRQLLRVKEEELRHENKLERVSSRIDRIRQDIEAVEATVELIDDATDPQQARHRLQLLHFQKIMPIEKQIANLGLADVV